MCPIFYGISDRYFSSGHFYLLFLHINMDINCNFKKWKFLNMSPLYLTILGVGLWVFICFDTVSSIPFYYC